MPNVELSPVKRALLELREMRARVEELEARAREPIAIVGTSIRAPGGVTDIAGFARLLWSGTDAIGEIPADRWRLAEWYDEGQDTPGKMYTRHGGFLDAIAQFDAEFFGVAPVEAASMDPQQRLALELAWEALEDAGQAPTALAGTRTGVYLGVANGDYGRALFAHPELIDPYFSPGTAYSVVAGRIAYVLGLHGPAIAIDTACSSSLVALHLACQGLRHGDCSVALAGGVNVILTPEMNVNFSKAGMMSRDGRCRTFDAGANGYVRGEGGGIVVLRRLRDALADGDRILAVVRGSAINQDGRSNGLTAPNGPAQQAVVRGALDAAGVAPSEVGYVEAHGTGTSLGDPIEIGALAAVLGDGRDRASPVVVGSVKTNVGHVEAAAGMMGVMKAILALDRGEIPPNLHFETPNPFIDWASIPITVPTKVVPWPTRGERRVAGVSSFGFSGTNAHVILESSPPRETMPATDGPDEEILTLSARDAKALRELAERYHAVLTDASRDGSVRDVCGTANAGRTHFAHRLSVTGSTASALADGLAHWLRGSAHPRVVAGKAEGTPRVAFLFPGQGPQYAGMGRRLYETAPEFRRAFDECAAALEPLLGRPLAPIVFPPDGDPRLLHQTVYSQPAMFTIEYALAALWQSWGIAPAAVMGHSFGEYAAACVAGVVSLGDAARMVEARGRLATGAPGEGRMMILEASADEAMEIIATTGGAVAIAAINGPSNTVISGERASVDAVAASIVARGRRATPLRVSHAFHSPLMDPVLDAFERELAPVSYAAPRTTLVSNLTGEPADLATIGRARYWRDHLRQPVRFAQSIRALASLGITHYLEMSPHPVLLGMGAECVAAGTWLPSLRQEQSAWAEMLATLQALYADGAAVDWQTFTRSRPHRRVALPTYPFQRKRHWIDAVGTSAAARAEPAADPWMSIVRSLDRESRRGPIDIDAAAYPAIWDHLARVTDAQIARTLTELGAFTSPGEAHTIDSLLSTTGIVPGQRRLTMRWLGRLTAAGMLRREHDRYIAVGARPDSSLTELWAEVERRLAGNRELLSYIQNCATQLAAIMTGRTSPLESLFPGGSFELATALYERSATMRYVNALAASAVESLQRALPAKRTLRVMEIGAGTGGTTSSVLDALPREGIRYRFTDVSDVFLDAARARFGDYPGLELGRFDLDLELEPQGYAAGSFDVILAANAVHAVRDLREALRRLRSLLAPGGVLILIESTTHLAYFDITTGLIEGWQHFADDLRADDPLLPPERWIAALRDAGMADARAWPERGTLADALGQHVIVAVAPGCVSLDQSETSQVGASNGRARDASVGLAPAVPEHGFRERLVAALPTERTALICDLVRSEVMRILRLDPGSPPARTDRLMDLGMDSLMAVQLRNALTRALELDRGLPSTLMFDYPTIDAIAGYVLDRVAPASAVVPSLPVSRADEPAPMTASAVAALTDEEIAALLLAREGGA